MGGPDGDAYGGSGVRGVLFRSWQAGWTPPYLMRMGVCIQIVQKFKRFVVNDKRIEKTGGGSLQMGVVGCHGRVGGSRGYFQRVFPERFEASAVAVLLSCLQTIGRNESLSLSLPFCFVWESLFRQIKQSQNGVSGDVEGG